MKMAEKECDLMVIGAGMAGMSAALFAAEKNISTVQAGVTGEINFASGLIDLMAVYPAGSKTVWSEPWKAVDAVSKGDPAHPYSKISKDRIKSALDGFFDFMASAGQPYTCDPDKNTEVITATGSIKTTYGVPKLMENNAVALKEKPPCLMVDFQGLKGYSATQIVERFEADWPGLRVARIKIPDLKGEVYIEQVARTLESEAGRAVFAELIRPHIKKETFVGLPGVLGLYQPHDIWKSLERSLKVKLFEIPTMPPGVTGVRMREAFERKLPEKGIVPLYQKKVLSVRVKPDNSFVFEIGTDQPDTLVRSRAAILATGRFFGKGLTASRTTVKESVFDLPVTQPASRELWHSKDFLSPQGHALNRAGLETDGFFRPLDRNRNPAIETLFAAGSILAGSDWTRLKCGAGVAVATAYAAVCACEKMI